jgi:hypothetical protein
MPSAATVASPSVSSIASVVPRETKIKGGHTEKPKRRQKSARGSSS